MSVNETSSSDSILDGNGCIARDLACAGCGHTLRGLPVTGFCGECGRPVGETAAAFLPQIDEAGRIAVDLPCVGCGYNLRMQPVTGACPECAADVARSARGHYLQYADPTWVRRIATGGLLLFIAATCSLAMPLVGIAVATAVGAGDFDEDAAFATMLITCCTAGIVFLWLLARGVWLLTTPDPAAGTRPEGFTARRVARGSLLVLPVAVVFSLLIGSSSFWFPFAQVSPIIILISVVMTLAYLVIPLALLRHGGVLMRRIPRPGLVTYSKIEFWGTLFGGLVHLLSYGAMMLALSAMTTGMATLGGPNMPAPAYASGPNAVATMPALGPNVPGPIFSPFGPLMMIASFGSMIGGCSMLVAMIAGYVLLILVWRALTDAARRAETNAPRG